MKVSTFKNIRSKTPINISVLDLLHRFKTEDKNNIASLSAMNKKDYDAAKKNLPVVTFQGTFEIRRSDKLLQPSGLLVLDFDNVSLEATKKALQSKDFIFSYFISPSGKGIKALVRIPTVKTDAEYKVYFSEIEKHFPQLDKSGKDISRACFFCYDPDLYLNKDAKIFTVDPSKFEKRPVQKINVDRNKNDYKVLNRCCELIRHAQEGERHNKILKASRLAGGFVASGIIQQSEAERILIQEADLINDDWKDNIQSVKDGIENGLKSPLTLEKLNEELKSEESVIKFGKIYYTAADLSEEIDDLYLNGNQKGFTSGHKDFDSHYTCKLGSTTYVYGAPYSGKTQFWFELLLCYSEKHGLRHAIFSPETGTAAQIFAELISMKARGNFYKTYNNQISLKQMQEAKKFIDQYFIVIDPKNNILHYKDFFAYLNEIERVYNTKIHTATIDPFNEFRQDLAKFNGRQDLYLEAVLTEVRENARIYNRHNCIITHVQDQQIKEQDGVRFYPLATYRQIAGGQAWSRKGMAMLSVWRPKEGLKDQDGEPFAKNTTVVDIQKEKPKGIGKLGTVNFLYNVNSHRYTDYYSNHPDLDVSEIKVKSTYSGYDEECGF